MFKNLLGMGKLFSGTGADKPAIIQPTGTIGPADFPVSDGSTPTVTPVPNINPVQVPGLIENKDSYSYSWSGWNSYQEKRLCLIIPPM
jgi:hypothetical protein